MTAYLDPGEDAAMHRLWGTVLNEAIIDCLSPGREAGPRDVRRDRAKKGLSPHTRAKQIAEAYAWLDSEDFVTVCTYAGVNPTFVYEHVEPLVEAPADVRLAFVTRLSSAHINCDRHRKPASPPKAA